MGRKKLHIAKALEDRISPALFPGADGIEDLTVHTDPIQQPSNELDDKPTNAITTNETNFNNSSSSEVHQNSFPENQNMIENDTLEINENQDDNDPNSIFFLESANEDVYVDNYDVLTAEFSDTSHEVWYNDGSGHITDETGSEINWDDDGSYHYKGSDGTQCHYHADGSGSYIFPDQSIATWSIDGSGLWDGNDGTEGIYQADGSGKIIYPDGSGLKWDSAGMVNYIDSNGHTIPENQFERGEFVNDDGSIDAWYDDGTASKTDPDGTMRTYYPDGSGETHYFNGSVETWNNDGSYSYEGSDGFYFTIDSNGAGKIVFPDGETEYF